MKWLSTHLQQLKLSRQIQLFRKQRTDFYSDVARFLRGNDIGDWLAETPTRLASTQPRLAAIYQQIYDDYVSFGLTKALANWVPPEELTVIATAHASGSLPEILQFLSSKVKKTQKLKSVMKLAAFSSCVTVGVGAYNFWVLAASIMPSVESMGVKPAMLHGVAYAMYLSAKLTLDFGPYIFGLLVCLCAVAFKTLPTWQSPLRRKFDSNFLPYRMYREYQNSLFLTAFSVQLSAKQGSKESIEEIAKTANKWMRWHCQQMLNIHIKYGLNSKMFQTGLFSQRIADRIGFLSKTGSFDDAIKEIGSESLDDTLEFLINSATWMELFFGGVATALAILVTLGQGPLMDQVLLVLKSTY